MGSLPWIKWYPSKWLSSETRIAMNAVERCVYRDLLDFCYEKGSIPSDRELLIKLVDLPAADFDAAWPKVKRCFEPQGNASDRLINGRVLEQLSTRGNSTDRVRKYRQRKNETRETQDVTRDVTKPVTPTCNTNLLRGDKEIDKETEENKRFIPRSESVGDLAGFFEERYALHPKKRLRTLAEQAMCSVAGIDTAEVQAEFRANHDLWCESEEWRWKAGAKAPDFAQFINDQTWRYKPPEVIAAETADKREAERKSDGTDPDGYL